MRSNEIVPVAKLCQNLAFYFGKKLHMCTQLTSILDFCCLKNHSNFNEKLGVSHFHLNSFILFHSLVVNTFPTLLIDFRTSNDMKKKFIAWQTTCTILHREILHAKVRWKDGKAIIIVINRLHCMLNYTKCLVRYFFFSQSLRFSFLILGVTKMYFALTTILQENRSVRMEQIKNQKYGIQE